MFSNVSITRYIDAKELMGSKLLFLSPIRSRKGAYQMSNFPILVKTPLIFPIPWAPAPFPERGVRALYKTKIKQPHVRWWCGFFITWHTLHCGDIHRRLHNKENKLFRTVWAVLAIVILVFCKEFMWKMTYMHFTDRIIRYSLYKWHGKENNLATDPICYFWLL